MPLKSNSIVMRMHFKLTRQQLSKAKGFISMTLSRFILISTILLFLKPGLKASTSANEDAKIYLDDEPIISARSSGLGGAMSTVADGIHAPFFNPAGIGGVHGHKTNPPFVRLFHFPYLGSSFNKNGYNLYTTLKGNKENDTKIAEDLLNTSQGQRHYARLTGLFGIVLKRLILLYYSDSQIAAYHDPLEDSVNNISTTFKAQSGPGAGFSVTDNKAVFSLGVFTYLNQKSLYSGQNSYESLVSPLHNLSGAFRSDLRKYSGLATNLGMIWVLGKEAKPTLALVVKDIGTTKYSFQGDSSILESPKDKTLTSEENITLGFSISPKILKIGIFNLNIEAQKLSERKTSLYEKIKISGEAHFGGFGKNAFLGLRAGYNHAGPSMGINLDLGLTQFELSSHSEDIGIGNAHVVERRYTAVFSVDVLEN